MARVKVHFTDPGGPGLSAPSRPAPPPGLRAVGSLQPSEADTLAALRSGDEAAFGRLIDELSPGLLRMARVYVSTDAAAEEVLQETWLGVLRGIERFEGRSTLKTWIYRILINVAKTRGVRDSRSLPFSSAFAGAGDDEEGLGPDRFLGGDHDRYPGHWAVGPVPGCRGARDRRGAAGDRGYGRAPAGPSARGDHAARHGRLHGGGDL